MVRIAIYIALAVVVTVALGALTTVRMVAHDTTRAYGATPLASLGAPPAGLHVDLPLGWAEAAAVYNDRADCEPPASGRYFQSPDQRVVGGATTYLAAGRTMEEANVDFFIDRAALPRPRLLAADRLIHAGGTFQILEIEFTPASQGGRRMVLLEGNTIVGDRRYRVFLTGAPDDRVELRKLLDRMIATVRIDTEEG